MLPDTNTRSSKLLDNLAALLAHRAPYLEDKLLHLGVVDTREEAAELFQEVKKYLALADSEPMPMFSARVDEAWHQFALFTREYSEFCQAFAGAYLHHNPAESGRSERSALPQKPLPSFEDFQRAYELRFGALPTAWFDERHLAANTRLARTAEFPELIVRPSGDRVELVHVAADPIVVCRTSIRAAPALRFIAAERVFLLRELPELSAADRIQLCQPLVKYRVLRVAP